MKTKEPNKKDVRKIPSLFRATEKDERPNTYYGFLVSDDGFNFVCFATVCGEGSHFKERTLSKRDFSFSKLDKNDFELHARVAVSTMEKGASDKKMDYEAADFHLAYAKQKLQKILS